MSTDVATAPTGLRAQLAALRPATGQATQIEQSRAVAEVYASVMVAQQMPRNEQLAIKRMNEATDRLELARKAFWRFPRDGQTLTGPTIHLARELARCWGNVHSDVAELARDDDAAVSEMLAYAWDLETNNRVSTRFIVPHFRDTKQGVKPLRELRDVYDNNANAGARRLRECILSVLPGWFAELAEERCRVTLTREGERTGKPLAQRSADIIRAFEGEFNIVAAQLEEKLGRISGQWTELDLVLLAQVGKAIRTGETTKAEEFPTAPPSGEEIRQGAIARAAEAAKAATPPPAEPEPTAAEAPADPPVLILWACDEPNCGFQLTAEPDAVVSDEQVQRDRAKHIVGSHAVREPGETPPVDRAAAFKAEQAARRARRPATPAALGPEPEAEPAPPAGDEPPWPTTARPPDADGQPAPGE